ncbi:MAG TPA: type II secretion system minor pseudopilin GspK [Steroidobacteraceae bacterium]|jgi:general secretion pathway protein K|nr:type II secretion system minor pseudopilin GspK [Steroidobacteraceae bacterium]
MSPSRNIAFKQQRGVALIMAILIVALATILAVSVASDGYMDQRRASVAFAVDQAYEAALGGEALAANALSFAQQQKQTQGQQATDDLTNIWAKPQTLPIEDYGEIRGNIEDLQGRFNLNNLVNATGVIDPAILTQFTNLLAALQMDTRWAGIIADWIDRDNNPNFPDGAEDSVYSLLTPQYFAANRPLLHTSELLAVVDGAGKPFGLENYQKLEPFVTALPIDTPLNVCTAPPEVLASLGDMTNRGQELITASARTNIAEGRKAGCYTTISYIRNIFQTQDKTYDTLVQQHGNYLAEQSKFFRANIFVTLGTTEIAMYSVLQRTGNGTTVHVISRSFGSP